MAHLHSTGGHRQKKKSAAAAGKKPRSAPGKKPRALKKHSGKATTSEQAGPVVRGQMERTRRLLLAALRVWELKRRVRE
jgi:hypothetical protein